MANGDSPIWTAFTTATEVEIRRPPTSDQDDPSEVRKEMLIERVCLPIWVRGEVLGVVDLRWQGTQPLTYQGELLHHSLEDLRELVRRLAEAIDRQKARDLATRARRALDGVALILQKNFHDLARSVQGISAGINKLRRRAPTAEQAEIIEQTQESVQRAVQLLGRVQEAGTRLARPTMGRCRLDKLLQEACSKYAGIAEKRGIRIQFEQVMEVEVYADGGQLLECFSNLIDNAIKAMQKGGELELSARVLADANLCEACIRDTGPGMEQKDIERYLSGERIPGQAIHIGVGIFLARLYCESHNGQLELRSELGKGTVARVLIPLMIAPRGGGKQLHTLTEALYHDPALTRR